MLDDYFREIHNQTPKRCIWGISNIQVHSPHNETVALVVALLHALANHEPGSDDLAVLFLVASAHQRAALVFWQAASPQSFALSHSLVLFISHFLSSHFSQQESTEACQGQFFLLRKS